ncbi:MAG: GatB/YqeY domain-containing protein [Patescibacteria group bacterium]
MSLKADISRDLVGAMKSHDELRVGVLRLITAAMKTRSIEKRGRQETEELSDIEITEVLRTEVKKRREAAQIFEKAGRNDLAEKELSEIKVIEGYLPAQMDAHAVDKAVKEILGRSSFKNFGEAMKAAMAELKGKADAKFVGDAVRKIIGE